MTVVFQHDLKDPLTQLVFRAVEEHRQQPSVDLGSVRTAELGLGALGCVLDYEGWMIHGSFSNSL